MGGRKLKIGPNTVSDCKNKTAQRYFHWWNRFITLREERGWTRKYQESEDGIFGWARWNKDRRTWESLDHWGNKLATITWWCSSQKIHKKTLHSIAKPSKQITVDGDIDDEKSTFFSEKIRRWGTGIFDSWFFRSGHWCLMQRSFNDSFERNHWDWDDSMQWSTNSETERFEGSIEISETNGKQESAGKIRRLERAVWQLPVQSWWFGKLIEWYDLEGYESKSNGN